MRLLAPLAFALVLAACGGSEPASAPAAPRATAPSVADFTVLGKELLNMGSRGATARFTIIVGGRETSVDAALVLERPSASTCA